jgi:hypothetical protein
MLGLGRASQYAGWFTGKPTAKMTVPVELNQAVYQTPSYSYKMGLSGDTNAAYPSNAVIDLSNFLSVPNTNNRRWTMFCTFQMNWANDLAPGPGNFIYVFLQSPKFVQAPAYPDTGFWSLNTFLQLRDNQLNTTGRMETNITINRVTGDLPGAYQDYNNRWLTFAYSGAESSTLFANWSTTTNSPYYARGVLWDTETRERLQVLDIAFNQTGGFPDFVQYANQVTNLPMNVGAVISDYAMSDGIGLTNQGGTTEPIRFSQLWAAYGSMFDPANPPDTSMFTTRPASQLGNAVAWYNTQYVEYVNNGTQYHVKDQGQSLYNQANDRMITLGYNESTFAAGYSTTIIPKDRS